MIDNQANTYDGVLKLDNEATTDDDDPASLI